jgi:hypothetical protein
MNSVNLNPEGLLSNNQHIKNYFSRSLKKMIL